MKPLLFVRDLVRNLGPERTRDQVAQLPVYCVVDPQQKEPGWERTILEMANGRTVKEIQATLYNEEVKGGAWAADIGVWRNIFEDKVYATIVELKNRGDISLKDKPEATVPPAAVV